MTLPSQWPASKGRAPTRKFGCPVCKVMFAAPGSIQGGKSGKVCPAGHFSTLGALYAFEKSGKVPEVKPAGEPAKPICPPGKRKTPLALGLTNDMDRYQLAAVSLLAGYDRALATLPPGARLMVEGAFGSAPAVARKILEPA